MDGIEAQIDHPEAGFSLVEVIVAVVLLGVLAVVTLPLFLTGIRVSADDGTRTTATARVGALLEQARVAPTCAKLKTLATQNQGAAFSDTRGRVLRLTMSIPTCTAGVAAAIGVTVLAANSAGTTVSSASTIIYATS